MATLTYAPIPSRLIYIRRVAIELSKILDRKPTKEELVSCLIDDIKDFVSKEDIGLITC